MYWKSRTGAMAMAKTGQGLVEFAASKVGKVPYVYGCKGGDKPLTRAEFDALQKTYGKENVWDSDADKIGQVCCDCSGLISWYTGVRRSSTGFHDTANKVYLISTIGDAPVGALVWKQGHIGVYVGNGEYIAEDGSAENCRRNKLSNAKFTDWFLCVDIEYPAAVDRVDRVDSVTVGDTVRIKAGAVYGGLDPKYRGVAVPDTRIGQAMTVLQVARGEARLKEVDSWVALDYLTKQ